MSTKRLLLPFTGYLDAQALDCAIKLAQCEQATLVLLSLIVVRPGRVNGTIRLEQIQQSKDFLVFAARKAERASVPVESHEVYTYDMALSLTLLAQEQMCDDVLLFIRNREGILLQTGEVKRVLEQSSLSCCLVCIPTSNHVPLHAAVWTRLARWWGKPQDEGTALHIRAGSVDQDLPSFISDRLLK